jgi:hypothetical protein
MNFKFQIWLTDTHDLWKAVGAQYSNADAKIKKW